MATKEITPIDESKAKNGKLAAVNGGNGDYNADSIKVLGGMEAVRKRPAMYIDGEKVPAAQVVMTKLHAGGKFDASSYKVSGGLHGVGVSCVNALSEELDLEIWRDGFTWEQTYSKGEPTSKLRKTGAAKVKTGTKVHFVPDKTIFTTTVDYNFDTLSQRLRELAFLNKGLVITLTDERQTDSKSGESKRTEFKYNGGIAEFIKHLNRGKSVLHDKPIYMEADKEDVHIEIALQ